MKRVATGIVDPVAIAQIVGKPTLLIAEKAGRDPADIELSGLVMFALSEDKDDPELRRLAANVGFADYAAAQASPVMLAGTPDEVKREIERRRERTGLSYYIGFIPNERSYELLVRDVTPAFKDGRV